MTGTNVGRPSPSASPSLRSRGAAADSDAATVTIVAPTFVDVAEATGLLQVHDVTGHPTHCAWSSTGLAFGDLDNDGDSDFYVGNVGSPGRQRWTTAQWSGPNSWVSTSSNCP